MTREELLARFDGHEAVVAKETPFIKEQLALLEEGGWVGDPDVIVNHTKRGERDSDKRGLLEALCNEVEVRLERVAKYSQLGRQEIDNGDGDRALFYEHQAYLERRILEPMVIDIQMRGDAKATGAKGGANSWKPRKQ